MGENDLPRLLEQENAWREYANSIIEKTGESQESIFDARLGTQRTIATLMDEVSNQYGTLSSQPGAQVGGYIRNLEADINRTYDRQMEDVMRMSNSTGFNPGRAISDLEDSRASALRNLPHQGTLQAEQIISLLQGSLMPAQQTAQMASSARVGQGVASSSVAGNQASAINQIMAQTNAQRAAAAGQGILGATNSLANAGFLAALMSRGPATSVPNLA